MPDWILLFFTPFFNLLLYNKMSIMTNSFIITSLWFGLPSLFSSPTDNLKKKSPLWLSAKHSEGGAAEWVGLQSGRGRRVGGTGEWAGLEGGRGCRVEAFSCSLSSSLSEEPDDQTDKEKRIQNWLLNYTSLPTCPKWLNRQLFLEALAKLSDLGSLTELFALCF